MPFSLGNLTRITYDATAVDYRYDSAGRLISVERTPDASTPGERTFYTLDDAGNRTKEERQSWSGSAWVTASFTDYQYLKRCQLAKVIHPDGTASESDYDCDGRLKRMWDENHPSNGQSNPATQTYSYDLLGRLTSVSQPWTGAGGGNAVTAYQYDTQDHLTRVTDAEGNITNYAYVEPASDGVARVEIDLEGEALEGTVTTGAGKPVEGARVTADYRPASLNSTTTDASGRYRFEALPHQEGRLSATHRTLGRSAIVPVGPAAPAGDVDLVLSPLRTLPGRVLSARHEAVPGARVSLQVLGDRALETPIETTDFLGRFEAEVLSGARFAIATVGAPTELLWSGCIELPEAGHLTVVLPPGPTGTLRLRNRFTSPVSAPPVGNVVLATAARGLLFSGALAHWNLERVNATGDVLLEPGLSELSATQIAAGRYTAVYTQLPIWELVQLACAGQLGAGEEWQTLVPGGEVTLQVDTREPGKARQ